MRTLALVGATAVVLLIAQAGSSASNPPAFTCGTAGSTIGNWNSGTVSGGGTTATISTNGRYYCLTEADTYHLASGNGAQGGTITLHDSGGSALTLTATAQAATAGYYNWLAPASTTPVIHGTYTCDDSDPGSWAQDAQTGGQGFCQFQVVPAVDNTGPTISWTPVGAQLQGTVSLSYTAADPDSGISAVDVQTSADQGQTWQTSQVLQPGATGWNTANTPDGTYEIRLLAVNGTGGTTATSTTATATIDNTPPAITVTCNNAPCSGWYTTAPVTVAISATDSNVAQQPIYSTTFANPFLDPMHGFYDNPLQVSSSETLAVGVSDNFGNMAVVDVPIQIDTTAPPAPHVSIGSPGFAFLQPTRAGAYVVWYNPAASHQITMQVPANDDPESGIASVSWPASLSQFPGWTISPNGTSADITWAPQLSTGPSFGITSTDNAGMTSPTTSIGFSVDPNPPTGGVTCSVANCSNPNGPVTVTAAVSDPQSGIRDIRYTTDGSTPTATTGTPGTSVTLTQNATVTFWAVDNVGNAGVVATQPVTASASAAGTFTVNSTSDTHDASPGDGLCADAQGKCTLRAAVEEADALPAGSTIQVPPGTYQLSLRQNGFGALTVSNGMTIAGAGAATTTIAAPGDDRAFHVTGDPVGISGLTISGGLASASNGYFGGNVLNSGNLTLSQDAITNGVAASGGGVSNAGGTLTVDRSTIANNTASIGGADSGGIQNYGDGVHHSIVNIENSTIANNTASLGGGVFQWSDQGDTTMTTSISDSTIDGNTGGARGIGGIGGGGTFNVRNSIVANNTVGGAASNCDATATIRTLGHNIDSSGDCPFSASGDILNVDPQLGQLQDNGGPTPTLLPAATSPVINAGADATCPPTDQRGTLRPQGPHCDIGAVEVSGAAAGANGFVVTTTADSGPGSLRAAITAANASTVGAQITFAIALGGAQVIHLASPLPAIQQSMTIDATTEPGWIAAPIVTLDGSTVTAPPSNVAPSVDGLSIQAPNVTVRGLVADSFTGSGIHVGPNAAGATIAGDAATHNALDGIRVEGPNAVVGGTSPLDRDVAGGNAQAGIHVLGTTGAVVRGDYAGTDATGAAANANAGAGISISGTGNAVVGGNVASGNTLQGISIVGSGNTVYGNIVGLTVAGTTALGNGGDGVAVQGTGNAVGGTGTGQGNTIADNGGNGVSVLSTPSTPSTGDRISGNSITNDGGAGIHLDPGANDNQPAPTVSGSGAANVTGSLSASPSTTYTIEVFQSTACDSSGSGEGAMYVGNTTATTDQTGAATWTLAASVDPGTVATATATAPNGDTSAFSTCTTIASTNLNATFTVDQSTTNAGASSFALSSLPPQLFTQLATGNPSSAPIPTAPIPTAAVGAAPIPTAPIPTAPIPTAPIPTAPIPTAPIPTAPIPTAPIPTAGLFGIPIPTAGVANPLDSVLLSSIPKFDVSKIFACTATTAGETNIAGKLPQQYTLGDIYRSPCATAYVNSTYQASDVPLGATLLRGVRTLSYLLGGKHLADINVGAPWCTALTNAGGSCAGVDPTQTTVIGLDIMHQLGTLDLGQLTVSNLTNGLAGTLVGQADLARIAFQKTTIASIPTSAVPGAVSCSAAACPTLGDAARLGDMVDGVTLASLPQSAFANVTLSELVVAMTPPNALPWEQESFLGWQGFGGQAQQLQYHLDFDQVCPITGLSVRIRLPYGFVYVPQSSTVQIGSGAPSTVADPTLDPKNGATYTNIPVASCPSGSQHIRLNFQGEAGYRLGASLSTAIITANGQSTKITDAPVFVQRNWTAALSRSTEPQIAPDTIYLSHIDSANGTNYFKLPEVQRGELVTIYMRPPVGSDYDLYVVRPAPSSLLASPIPTAPIPTAPIPTAPIPTAPIPTADTSVNTTTDNPAPELLDDGPLPGGQVSVDSITRGDGVESVTFRQAGNTGFDEIAVAGYNGAYSSDPFELRVVEQDPPPLPATCPDRTLPTTTPGVLPVGVDPATENIALVNVGRMNAMYPGSAGQMLSDLQTVFSAQNKGVVIPVDGDAGVRAAASAWDHNVCSPDAANNYVHAINTLVASYRANLPNLKTITIVGDDEQIPFARVPDFVPVNSETDNAGTLAFLTKGSTVDDAAYAASALGYVLTDDAYGAFHTRTLFGHEFFLPEVGIGRLVETPAEIDGQLQQYIANTSHVLDAHSGFVTGYDFMSDAAQAVDDNLVTRIGAAGAGNNTLLRDTWGKSALQGLLAGTTPSARINSWNAHYDYHRLMPAVYTGPSDLLSTDLVPAGVSQQFGGNIFFTMGCHAGESIDDSLLPASGLTRDWAQTFSQTGAAVFIGNTGFGYGDTASVALSERLMSLFAGHLAFNGEIGDKLMVTKNEYFSSMGAYGPYDEKAIEEATFYGLPFWQVNSPSEASATPPGPVGAPDAHNISTAPLTLTPHLTKVADARGTFWTGGDGTVFVPGRSVQPLVTLDVTQPAGSGLVAHGFFPNALVTDDSNKNLNLYFAKPMIDLGSHEPEPLVTNDVFPASPVKMAQADYLGQRHSTLDLIAGQSRPGSTPSLQNERLITSVSGLVTYAPASATDFTPPQFGQTGSYVANGTATIFATVTDDQPAGVIAVRAFFTNGGPWQFVDLQPVSGTPGLWEATNVAVNSSTIEVGFVAEDATGNTGWMTGKGILVDSYTPSSPPPAPSIVIKSPLDGATYTLGQSVPSSYSCTAQQVLQSCAGPVSSGSSFDTSSVGPKQFQVTATPVLNSSSTTSKTANYSVVYNFGGFQAPIAPNALNIVKAGSAVPVQFSLHGNFGLGILAGGYPQSAVIPCTGGTVDTGIATTTAGSSALSYDATTDTYTYVWKTQKSWSGTCQQLLVVLNDGVAHRANFQFK